MQSVEFLLAINPNNEYSLLNEEYYHLSKGKQLEFYFYKEDFENTEIADEYFEEAIIRSIRESLGKQDIESTFKITHSGKELQCIFYSKGNRVRKEIVIYAEDRSLEDEKILIEKNDEKT